MIGPALTVDIIIEIEGRGIVLVSRKNPPHGWALPGGFVDLGESTMAAAIRESAEETCLDIFDVVQFHTYSDPERDPRGHAVSVVYIAKAVGEPRAADDAKKVVIASLKNEGEFRKILCFDHGQIVEDYLHFKKTGERPTRE
jgi:8-oxo-dGTP diphosphatase